MVEGVEQDAFRARARQGDFQAEPTENKKGLTRGEAQGQEMT